MAAGTNPPQRRILLLGPTFAEGEGGGLSLVLRDLEAELERRGWSVDRPEAEEMPAGKPASDLGVLGALMRSGRLIDIQAHLPRRVRRWLIEITRPAAFLERSSDELRRSEAALRTGRYDAVIVCTHSRPPGLLALASRHHPRVIAVSLGAIADELCYRRLWSAARLLSRARLGSHRHACLYREVRPQEMPRTIFASDSWRSRAVAAGFPADRGTTVYFGVPVGATAARPEWSDRFLWVGRLAPEKRLHSLLSAWPAIRRDLPRARLTVIGASATAAYASLIAGLLAQNGDGVTSSGPRPRAELAAAYRDHDALVFYSVFDEPVALVVLEAFAAGLPVIASRPATRRGPLREDETCVCFDPNDPCSLPTAILRLRNDPALAARLVDRARKVVCEEFSLDRMGALWEAHLR